MPQKTQRKFRGEMLIAAAKGAMMKLMIFPKMLVSHRDGWDWLMHTPPAVTRTFLAYVMPMSLIPPAMLLYAYHAYLETRLPEISAHQAILIASVLYVVQLIVVPLMAAAVQRIGGIIDTHPSYQQAFAYAAAIPTPLWISPLVFLVPSLALNVLTAMLALLGSGMMIFKGVYRTFRIEDDGTAQLLAGSILAAGTLAWVGMLASTLLITGLLF